MLNTVIHRSCTVVAGCAFVAGLAGVAPAAEGADIVVNMYNFEFSTGPIGTTVDPTINVGDTVRWLCLEGFHSATSVGGIAEQWDSGLLRSGQSYSHTFTTAGRYEYYCLPHGFDVGNGTAGGMAGVITVVPAPGAACLAVVAGGLAFRRRRA